MRAKHHSTQQGSRVTVSQVPAGEQVTGHGDLGRGGGQQAEQADHTHRSRGNLHVHVRLTGDHRVKLPVATAAARVLWLANPRCDVLIVRWYGTKHLLGNGTSWHLDLKLAARRNYEVIAGFDQYTHT